MPFADWLKSDEWHFGLPENYLDEIKSEKYSEIYKYISENKGSYRDKDPSNPQNLIKESSFFIDKTPRYLEYFEAIYNKVGDQNIPVFLILKHFDDIFHSQCIKRKRSPNSFFVSIQNVIKSLKYLKENVPNNVYVFSYRNFVSNADKYVAKIEEVLYKCNPDLREETLSIAKFEKKIEGLSPPYPYSNWKSNREEEKTNLSEKESKEYKKLKREFDSLLEDIRWKERSYLRESINFITFWEPAWKMLTSNSPASINNLLNESCKSGVNTVCFDMRWLFHEEEEGKYNFSLTDEMCQEFIKHGFKLLPLLSIGFCPNWIFDKYPEIVEKDEGETLGIKRINYCHKQSMSRALKYMNKCIEALEPYRGHIISVSVSWNNEHETKLTQTHNQFRPYDGPSQNRFRQFLKENNSCIEHWNDRWNSSFSSFNDIESPKIGGNPHNQQIKQFKDGGQFIFDFFAFRRCLLIDTYKQCCELIKSHGYSTWLHFCEIFTCIDAIYQSDILFYMIDKPWLDIVVMDSNLSKIGAEENSPFVSYITLSACKKYNKPILFELAFERIKSLEGYKQCLQYAADIGTDGLGYANITANAEILQTPEDILVTSGYDSKRKQDSKKIMVIYPISGCLILRQRQDHCGCTLVDPIQERILRETKYWYDLGYEVDIVGYPQHLDSTDYDLYHTIILLEPLGWSSLDIRSVSQFIKKMPSNTNFKCKKLEKKSFNHQEGFDGKPFRFLSIEDNTFPEQMDYGKEKYVQRILSYVKRMLSI